MSYFTPLELLLLGFILFAYLLGSLSGAVIIARLFHLHDPRTAGSNNPGTSNMLRLNGKWAGISVLIFDMLKGMIPVYLAYRMEIPSFYLGIIAIAACLGHIFPCFFRFRGGKGVATAMGALLLISFDSSLWIILTWMIVLFASGYVSIATLLTCVLAPLFVWLIRPEFTIAVSMLCTLIMLRHLVNIQRLVNHAEPSIYGMHSKRFINKK